MTETEFFHQLANEGDQIRSKQLNQEPASFEERISTIRAKLRNKAGYEAERDQVIKLIALKLGIDPHRYPHFLLP